jgi:hypothetical protein
MAGAVAALAEKVTDAAGAALDKVNPPKGGKTPPEIEKRLKRGRERLNQVAPRRREAVEFARGNHYVSIDKSGLKLVEQSTVPKWAGGEKPDHRVRRSRDLIGPILKAKISGATQRIPGYEVVPSSSDPEDYSATRISEKVLTAGYTLWKLKRAFRRFVWNALVTEEAFIAPIWDASIGPFIEAPDGSQVGMGDVRPVVYSGLEVIWEPGVPYEESSWMAIEHARPCDQVEAEPDFIGDTKLKADADEKSMENGLGLREKPRGGNLCIVTEFLERPCPKYPKGQRKVFANGREIFPVENYPLEDHKGEIVDEPFLKRIAYSIDGVSDRDRGLVQSMIESMRQYDYGANKAAEYLQLVLVPQIMAAEGAVKGVIDDEPGAVVEIDPDAWAEGEAKWREMPPMPREYMEMQSAAQTEMNEISHTFEVPQGTRSAQALSFISEKDTLAWNDFMEDLAEAYAAFARDSLSLVQLRYTEDRMVKFRGLTGWEAIADFRGADIRGQRDVRVSAGSLEPLTQAKIEQRILSWVGPTGLFPGHFPPELVMRALSSNDLDVLNQSYEEDEARVNFIISQIRAGTFWDIPDRPVFPGEEVPKKDPATGEVEWIQPPQPGEPSQVDEATGEPIPGTEVPPTPGIPVLETMLPGWMPRPFDNIAVHKLRIETFMKSDEWPHLPPEDQKATMDYYRGLIDLETKNAMRASELQTQRAEQMGMQNAAKPQGAKPLPDQPSPEAAGESEAPPAG